MSSTQRPRASSVEPGTHLRVRLFDADRPDARLDERALAAGRPTDRQLLWIDITGEVTDDDLARLAKQVKLHPRTRRALLDSGAAPLVSLHRDYLHVRVAAEPSDRDPSDSAWLDLLAGKNVVVSRHRRPITFLAEVDKRIERDTELGVMSAAAFFSTIVDAAITSYHQAVDTIESDVDRLDARSLRGDDGKDLLGDLVRARRRIARLRGLLADHRAVFSALASPDIAVLVGDADGTGTVEGLNPRFEGALRAVEDSREALLGSFDVLMSRTAQRTNEVVKALTLATVLLLPGSLIAGLLGMNVAVPLSKDDPLSFWIVVVAIAVLALAIVAVARARRWF